VGVREGRGDDAAWLKEWKGEGDRIGGVGVGRGGIKGEGEGEGVAKAEERKRNAMVYWGKGESEKGPHLSMSPLPAVTNESDVRTTDA